MRESEPARVGHEPATGTYFERLGPIGGLRAAEREPASPPLLFIPGGGATGACWRATPDGRLGWADRLAAEGRECWVTDWPGTGRSGNQDGLQIAYADVVTGYRRLLEDVIARPAVVVCHSMGGAVTWQLVEHLPELVTGVVAVAAAYPGNVGVRSDVVSDDGAVTVVDFGDTGVRMTVDRRTMNLYGDGYIFKQAIAGSVRFPRDRVASMRAGLIGLPPRMLLQRLGVEPGLPSVRDPTGFTAKPIRLIAGDRDPAHTRVIELRTTEMLRGWGADARLTWLPDRGIEGNGHYLMFESNSDEILEIVTELIEDVIEVTAT